ncbi:Transcriptional regulator of ribosomal biogenesis proteins [Chytridiales sp. JEL 0842]|nr:Transcriptional regulator of ribosomal biogenesis proteins [Chytridiales sp. JEL 0842]
MNMIMNSLSRSLTKTQGNPHVGGSSVNSSSGGLLAMSLSKSLTNGGWNSKHSWRETNGAHGGAAHGTGSSSFLDDEDENYVKVARNVGRVEFKVSPNDRLSRCPAPALVGKLDDAVTGGREVLAYLALHLAPRSPLMGPSPSRDLEQFNDLEDEFFKDFMCCGLTLDSLHDLLQHFEECHVRVESDCDEEEDDDDGDDEASMDEDVLPFEFEAGMDLDDLASFDFPMVPGERHQQTARQPQPSVSGTKSMSAAEILLLKNQLAASMQAMSVSGAPASGKDPASVGASTSGSKIADEGPSGSASAVGASSIPKVPVSSVNPLSPSKTGVIAFSDVFAPPPDHPFQQSHIVPDAHNSSPFNTVISAFDTISTSRNDSSNTLGKLSRTSSKSDLRRSQSALGISSGFSSANSTPRPSKKKLGSASSTPRPSSRQQQLAMYNDSQPLMLPFNFDNASTDIVHIVSDSSSEDEYTTQKAQSAGTDRMHRRKSMEEMEAEEEAQDAQEAVELEEQMEVLRNLKSRNSKDWEAVPARVAAAAGPMIRVGSKKGQKKHRKGEAVDSYMLNYRMSTTVGADVEDFLVDVEELDDDGEGRHLYTSGKHSILGRALGSDSSELSSSDSAFDDDSADSDADEDFLNVEGLDGVEMELEGDEEEVLLMRRKRNSSHGGGGAFDSRQRKTGVHMFTADQKHKASKSKKSLSAPAKDLNTSGGAARVRAKSSNSTHTSTKRKGAPTSSYSASFIEPSTYSLAQPGSLPTSIGKKKKKQKRPDSHGDNHTIIEEAGAMFEFEGHTDGSTLGASAGMAHTLKKKGGSGGAISGKSGKKSGSKGWAHLGGQHAQYVLETEDVVSMEGVAESKQVGPEESTKTPKSQKKKQQKLSVDGEAGAAGEGSSALGSEAPNSATTVTGEKEKKPKGRKPPKYPKTPSMEPNEHGEMVVDEKPYKCTWANCSKAYKNPGGLKYHLQHGHTETGEEIRSESSGALGEVGKKLLAAGSAAAAQVTAQLTAVQAQGKSLDELDAGILELVQKPYVCTVEDCGKRYKNLNGLKYHLEHAHPECLGGERLKAAKETAAKEKAAAAAAVAAHFAAAVAPTDSTPSAVAPVPETVISSTTPIGQA